MTYKVGQFITLEGIRYLISAIKYEPQEPPYYKLLNKELKIVWKTLLKK